MNPVVPPAPRPIPIHVSSNFKKIDSAATDEIRCSLKRHYFPRQIWGDVAVTAETWLSSDEGRKDLEDHLFGRLEKFRQTVIPWLDDAKPLLGATVLEIGCGTGTLTVALAEQGAIVSGVDIDEESIAVAKDRCTAYGLEVDFNKANATDLRQLFPKRHFDFIVFSATLEHMTNDERIVAMKETWNMLSKGSLWCVLHTPNRLWHFDGHTSLLPFYMWLPDALAFKYSKFSPRKPFCESYRKCTDDAMLSFRRHGRGVSFHEFDIAIKKTEELKIISCLDTYVSGNLTRDKHESLLAEVGPAIHEGFYKSDLNLIIERD